MKIPSRFLALCSILSSLSVSVFSPTGFAANADKEHEMKHLKTEACQSDINKFCKDITPGQGRTMACLKSHEDKLSAACSKEWQSAKSHMKKEWKEAKKACGSDVDKFCKDASSHMEVSKCLDQHMAQLSGSCKSFHTSMKERMQSQRTG